MRVHPDSTGERKNGPQALGRSRGGRTTKVHLVATSYRCALKFLLTAGQRGDAPAGRELLGQFGRAPMRRCALRMDGAYEGNETRALALRLFLAAQKAYRRVFTRYDKLDAMFTAFLYLALIFDALGWREQALGRCGSEAGKNS